MKIIFIGIGYVGLVTSLSLASHNKKEQFVCYDINKESIAKLQKKTPHFYEPGLLEKLNSVGNIYFTSKWEDIKDGDIYFICVGTPLNKDNNWDLSYMYSALETIIRSNANCSIVIKSTVPIGTTENVQYLINKKGIKNIEVFNMPEFLAQGTAVHDADFPNRIIIGADKNAAKLRQLKKLFANYKSPLLVMKTKASEMSKIAANNFLATKLSFINEISNICRNHGISSLDVLNSLKHDDRIGTKYMTPGIGYGGSCLPKDSKSLYTWSSENNYHSRIIKATIDVNKDQRTILCDILEKHRPQAKHIAILGLAFKQGTDDIRDSSAIDCINHLLAKKKLISVFDPKALDNTKKLFNKSLKYHQTIDECIKDAEAVLICCNWPEISKYNLENYCQFMKAAIVIDGFSIYNKTKIPKKLLYIPLNK